MALNLQSKVDTGRICPSRGVGDSHGSAAPLPLPTMNVAPGEVTHKDDVLSHYQFSPCGNPRQGP